MAQHCIEPVLHWEVPLSVRASSSLGAAAATAARAARGRRGEKRMNIFLVVEWVSWIAREAMGCFVLMVNCFATCHFIRRGPLPYPSASLCTQPVRPARMSVRRDRAYLPAIPSQQSNKEKKKQVCRETYEHRCWLGMPYDHPHLCLDQRIEYGGKAQGEYATKWSSVM